MTKISKKAAYPVKIPVRKDYFVGTDSENNGKTVNFDFESTAKLINEMNGMPILNYIFKTDNNIPLAVLTEGVFLSEGNERKGKGQYSAFSRFVGLTVIGIGFVPYAYFKRGKITVNQRNQFLKEYKLLIK